MRGLLLEHLEDYRREYDLKRRGSMVSFDCAWHDLLRFAAFLSEGRRYLVRDLFSQWKREIKAFLYQGKPGCNYPGCTESWLDRLTLDHIYPQAKARLEGWAEEDIHSMANLQLLCEEHHRLKDSPRPHEKVLGKEQISGVVFLQSVL